MPSWQNPFLKPERLRGVVFAAAVLLGPALVLWHLHGRWSPNGSYAFGWAVPPLAAYLLMTRWEDRPAGSSPVAGAALSAAVFAVAGVLPRWLQEAAPERGICAWPYALAAVGTSLSLMALAGGVAWLRWFSYPFIIILTAVPWPPVFEKPVTAFLMRGTAGATVETLCFAGIPSARSGSLVHIETGVLDIGEACSGIRSLQAMGMVALFLGELFRLKTAGRLLLLVVGLGVTLLANVLRTFVLGDIAFHQGMEAVDRYHDAAGLAVLAFSLTSTLLAAFLLRPAREPAPAPAPEAAQAVWVGSRAPLALSLALVAWLLLEETAVEAWYRLHEQRWHGWSWAVAWPRRSAGFHAIAIPERSLRSLMCDESQAAAWKEPDGTDWSLYCLRWNPGNAAAELAKAHHPDACLGAVGATLENAAVINLPISRTFIPFHSYTFLLGGKPLHVFFCLYEEGPGAHAVAANARFEALGLFERALQGRRRMGEQSLEFALSGYASEESAREAFKARLGEVVTAREGFP